MTDDWSKPRGRHDHFSKGEIAYLRQAYKEGILPKVVARELRCATRTVNVWFANFRAEGVPKEPGSSDQIRPRPRNGRSYRTDANFTGAAPKGSPACANAMPGISQAQLMSGRARPARIGARPDQSKEKKRND